VIDLHFTQQTLTVSSGRLRFGRLGVAAAAADFGFDDDIRAESGAGQILHLADMYREQHLHLVVLAIDRRRGRHLKKKQMGEDDERVCVV
jgi:hypothetical protein